MKKRNQQLQYILPAQNQKKKQKKKIWLTYEERKTQPDLDQRKIDTLKQKMEAATLDDAGWTDHCKTVARIT